MQALTASALPLYRSNPSMKSYTVPALTLYDPLYGRATDITSDGSSGIEPLDTNRVHWTTPPNEPPEPEPGPPPMKPYVEKLDTGTHELEVPAGLPVTPPPPPDDALAGPDNPWSKPTSPRPNPSAWSKLQRKGETS
ncbi:hypothetical protein ABW21_db0203399 [Orbilia brochopaga]|nr:hypothetical protein ABW21_db0203399 [Drechslerella brochopaga]